LKIVKDVFYVLYNIQFSLFNPNRELKMKDRYKIIKGAWITEKSTILRTDKNKYVLEVSPKANKIEIKQAAEEIFPDIKGKIKKINTIEVKGKTKGEFLRHKRGRRPNRKKAILTLEEGASIPIYEGI